MGIYMFKQGLLDFTRFLPSSVLASIERSYLQVTSKTTHKFLARKILRTIDQKNIKFIDCMFTDILGAFKIVTIPKQHFKKILLEGISFDGASLPGASAFIESDMLLKPDLSSFAFNSWVKKEVCSAHIICDVYRISGQPYENDPRSILKSVITQARHMGFEPLFGPEIEFFLFKKDSNHTAVPYDQKTDFDIDIDDAATNHKLTMLCLLAQAGIEVEKLHHETGPGQYEISLRYNDPITIADHILMTQHIIRIWAHKNNLTATFMPKPLLGESGNGMHIHFNLYDIKYNKNAFYDKNDQNKLSRVAQHFIAGILNRVCEMNLLLNPSVNSYQRLVPGYGAPTCLSWGMNNRSALIRIPQVNNNKFNSVRGELRSSDGSANPYLLLSAVLKAGLLGIQNSETLAPAISQKSYDLTLEEIHALGVPLLPASFEQALGEFKNSRFASDLLGDKLFQEFIRIKEKEITTQVI